MKVIKERLKAETPSFFKKMRNWTLIIGALAGFFITLPVSWPAWAVSGFSLIVAICTAIAGTSQLTKVDKKISP